MKTRYALLCAAALLAGCSTVSNNGGSTVFQGRFIGYTNEYVEFFLPQENGEFKEIQLNVKPDGSFCDTIQFDKNYYDAPLFADKFMFRICVEQGKSYNAEFDIREEGIETNFRFTGEGEAENTFLKHLWALHYVEDVSKATSFKDWQAYLTGRYAPLREELKTIANKPFVKYYTEDLATKEMQFSSFYPFFAASLNGAAPKDKDFDAFVSKNSKVSDEDFQKMLEIIAGNIPYILKGIDTKEAVKAAETLSTVPARKESAMTIILTSLVGAGSTDNLEEAYAYFSDTVENEDYLDQIDEICNNALLLAPGAEAPDIEMEDLSGKILHLADFAGKPLYIDLWASWCGPCNEEIPYLQKFVDSLGANPEIVCISISIDENRSDWENKLKEVSSTWPQYLATKDGQESISNKYFVSGIPRFLLIHTDGTIASVNAPRPSTPGLLEELKSLL